MSNKTESLDPNSVYRLSIVSLISAIISLIGAGHLYILHTSGNFLELAVIGFLAVTGFSLLILSALFRGVSKRIKNREAESEED